MNTHSENTQIRLRCADWRFLLPAPPGGVFEHLVLLGADAGLAAGLLEAGLARRVSRELPGERSADAAVLLRGALADVRAAAGCLVPGGVLYREVDRRLPGMRLATPAQTVRSLRRAGLAPAGLYWATPDFAACQRYLPLDVPGAVAWYLRTSFTAASPLRQLLGGGLRVLARLRGALDPLVRCYAVVALAGAGAEATPALLAHPELPRESRRPGTRVLLLTGGADDTHRIIALPFAPGATQPAAALKLARLPEFNHDTVSEQALLGWLRARLTPPLAGSVPRALSLYRHGPLVAGAESYLDGRSLSTIAGRWDVPLGRKIADMERVAEWLVAFHRQARIERRPWGREEIGRWVERPLADYARLLGTTDAEQELFAAARAQAEELLGAPFPLVWQHHNFGEWNVFRAGDAINVIDWEHARAGLPLYDLLHFAIGWSYSVRGLRGEADQLRAFRELFCDPAPGEASVLAARGAIDRYLEQLGIDRRFLPLVLAYLSVEKAVSYAEARRASRPAEWDLRAGNRSAAYVGVLASRARRLFAPDSVEA